MAVSVPPDAAGSVPPQNLEAEASVLGAILISDKALDAVQVEVRLRPDDFYRERHRLIYRAMLNLKEKPSPEAVDVLTVCEELERQGLLEEAGGTAYVHTLPGMVPAAGNAPHYAGIVKHHAMRRELIAASREIQDQAYTFAGSTKELIEKAEARMFRVGQEEHSGELKSIGDILHVEVDKLEAISREGISMSGTPSGFKELDDLTGGFQPGNLIVLAARPAMGKCLAGSALIWDPFTGTRRRIDELVEAGERGEDIFVMSMGGHFKLRPARATAFMRSGVQRTYRVTTRLGRSIDATANHPLLTLGGWREVGDLRPGTRIAVPRVLPRIDADPPLEMPDREIVLLAALIADGNLTQKTPRFCFGQDSPVLNVVQAAVEEFGLRLRGSERSHGTATISGGRGSKTNPVRELCIEHGLWGKRSEDKFVPPAIFKLGDEQIQRFLSVLYGCDGHVYASHRLRQIGYTTISERLAHDVQHLLLRLGIVSRIRTLRRPVYDGTSKVAREVLITGQAGLARFCELVPVCGKTARLERVAAGVAAATPNTNTDTIPPEVWTRISAARRGRPWRELSVATGRPPNHNWHVGTRGISRDLLAEVADSLDDVELRALAASDVWWDEIVSIEDLGEQETYDLTVPDTHNFVANDIVVHNSALVTNIAENAAVDHGRPVALFSLEMSETELAQRFIASRAKLNGDDLRKGRVSADRWPKVIQATEKLAKAPLYVDDSSDMGIMELRAKARRLHNRAELGLIVVDYLQLMRPEDPGVGRVEQIGQISRGLKILARELSIPVIAVSQLSRAVESRRPPIPMLSDLRESGNIEQDADVVMFIYRDEYYNPESTDRPGEADVIVAKHRNGPVDTIALTFIARHPKFANMYRDHSGLDPAGAGAAAV